MILAINCHLNPSGTIEFVLQNMVAREGNYK